MTWLSIYLMAHCACAGFCVGTAAEYSVLVGSDWRDWREWGVLLLLIACAPVVVPIAVGKWLAYDRRRAREAAAKRRRQWMGEPEATPPLPLV